MGSEGNCPSMLVGPLAPGSERRSMGKSDPVVPVGKGLGKPGSVGMGRPMSASSLGGATGTAKTIAVAESARIRRERMFAVCGTWEYG